jgi:two-component system osmolarity sensor histidine kinase EnvZ
VKLWPQSLVGRTAITISLTLSLFLVVSMTASFYLIIVPMMKRSADDFAAELVSAAHALQDLPEAQHAALREQLLQDHGLIVAEEQGGTPARQSSVPYIGYFSNSLNRLAGEKLPIMEFGEGPLLWVDVPAHGKIYRLGFDRGRLGTNPPLALLLVVAGGALLVIVASVMEVRSVTKPLDRLAAAVEEMRRGVNPSPLPEKGPEEIAALAAAFNQMSTELRRMSENRTVMLAGISHDLRTPLTRLGIAVEMLDEKSYPDLIAGIRRDLDVMNRLIGEFLRFSEAAKDEIPVQVDLWQTIESMTQDLEREGASLRLHRANPPCVYFADPVALQRVLANLLRNAVQYGNGTLVDVFLHCSSKAVSIEVCDRGPGIPADQVDAVFRPFHRLDSARAKRSGGSGLGLAVANQLATKHGWSIELLPRDGGGTIAKLGLPPSNRIGSCQTGSQPTSHPQYPG